MDAPMSRGEVATNKSAQDGVASEGSQGLIVRVLHVSCF